MIGKASADGQLRARRYRSQQRRRLGDVGLLTWSDRQRPRMQIERTSLCQRFPGAFAVELEQRLSSAEAHDRCEITREPLTERIRKWALVGTGARHQSFGRAEPEDGTLGVHVHRVRVEWPCDADHVSDHIAEDAAFARPPHVEVAEKRLFANACVHTDDDVIASN